MAKQYKELIRYLAFLVAVFFGTINSGGAMPDGDRYIFHVGQQYNSLVCFDIGYISQWRGLYGSDAVELLNQVYAQNNARCAEAFRSAPQSERRHMQTRLRERESAVMYFGLRYQEVGVSRTLPPTEENCIFNDICAEFIPVTLINRRSGRCVGQFENGMKVLFSCDERSNLNNSTPVRDGNAGFSRPLENINASAYEKLNISIGQPLFQGSRYRIVGYVQDGVIYAGSNSEVRSLPFFEICHSEIWSNYSTVSGFRGVELSQLFETRDRLRLTDFNPDFAVPIYSYNVTDVNSATNGCPWIIPQENPLRMRRANLGCLPDVFSQKINGRDLTLFFSGYAEILDNFLKAVSERFLHPIDCSVPRVISQWDAFEKSGWVGLHFPLEDLGGIIVSFFHRIAEDETNLEFFTRVHGDNLGRVRIRTNESEILTFQFQDEWHYTSIEEATMHNDLNMESFLSLVDFYDNYCGSGVWLRFELNDGSDFFDDYHSNCENRLLWEMEKIRGLYSSYRRRD